MPDLTIKPNAGHGNKVIIQDQAGAAVLTTADSGVSQLSTPAGHTLQVKQLDLRSTHSTTSTSYVDVPGYTLAITPSKTSSKVLVLMQFWMTTEGPYVWSKMVRSGGASGDGDIYKGTDAGSALGVSTSGKSSGGENAVNHSLIYLDSPGVTSAVTYKLQWRQRSSGTGRFNTHNDGATASATQPLFASTITLMEVAG